MNYYFCGWHYGVIATRSVLHKCPICNNDSISVLEQEGQEIADKIAGKKLCFDSVCRHHQKKHNDKGCSGTNDYGKPCTCTGYKTLTILK